MIAKDIDLTDRVKKSHGQRMKNCLEYEDQLHNADEATRPYVFYLNTMSDETGHAEMIALADSNPRAQLPVRHCVFSWKASERPTPEQAKEAAEIILRNIGADKCLAKFSLQFDTDHVHLHMVLCTVNPDDQTMVKMHFFEEKLHQSIAVIEHKQGWEPEVNARYSVLETGELVKNLDSGDYEVIRKKALHEKAARLERYNGQRSAQDIAQEVVGKVIRDKKVKTWAQFHQRLGDEGLQYKKARTGAVVIVRQGDEDVPVAASSIDRKAALKALEKRFGAYADATGIVKDRMPEPVQRIKQDPDLAAQHARYEEDRKATLARRIDYATLRDRQKAEFKAMAAEQRAKRAAAFLQTDRFGQERTVKMPFAELNGARSNIAFRAAAERAELRDRHAAERVQYKSKVRFPDFATWLSRQGETDLADRFTLDAGRQFAHGDLYDITKRDIRAYKALLIDDPAQIHYERGGRTDFVDYGKRVSFDSWRDPVAMRAALQLSAEKWPKEFTLTGSQDFKESACREAIALGIAKKIANPEMRDYINEQIEQRQREKSLAADIPQLIKEKKDHDDRIADAIATVRKNHQPRAAKAAGTPDTTDSVYVMPEGGLASLSNKRLEKLSTRVLHSVARTDRRDDSRLRPKLPADAADSVTSAADGVADIDNPAALAADGRGRREQRMNPIAAASQYLIAVNPDAVRVTSVRQNADGKGFRGFLLTPESGTPPNAVPWNEIARRDAKRHPGGDREHVYFTPLSQKMHHILIDDLDALRLAKLYADGFAPAVVIETSPGNFQAILNTPKLSDDEEINNRVDNRLTAKLNWPNIADANQILEATMAGGDAKAIELAKNLVTRVRNIDGGLGYGDRQISGGRHPTRIPGYSNNKTKNLQADGTYRVVNVIADAGGTCERTAALAQEVIREFNAQRDRIRTHDATAAAPRMPTVALDENSQRRLRSIYEGQRDAIKKIQPTVKDTALDLMIAQRMRATGYASDHIGAAIDLASRNPRQGDDYGQRTATAAFSTASDDTLVRQSRYVEAWKQINDKANMKIEKIETREQKISAYENLHVDIDKQSLKYPAP